MWKRLNPNPNPNPNESRSESENVSSLKTDEPPQEAAPKKRGRKPGSIAPARQTEALAKIKTTLEMIFGAAAGMAVAVGNGTKNEALARDGIILQPGSPYTARLIDAILVLCQQDKSVREFFLAMTTGSAYTNVLVASLPLCIAILANHNLIPPIFGSMTPVEQETIPNAGD